MTEAAIRNGAVATSLPPKRLHAARPTRPIPTVVRWLFLLFVFVLPYEYVGADLGIGSSIVKIPGFLFVASYCVFYVLSGRRLARPNLAMLCFLVYVAIFVVSVLLDTGLPDSVSAFTRLGQLLVFFLLTTDLAKNEKMMQRLLLAYTLGTGLLAVGMALGAPGFADLGEGRIATLGDNPNAMGQHMALSILVIIGLTLNKSFRRLRSKVLMLPLTIALMAGIVASGSRAAISALMIGALTFSLPHWRSRRILISCILVIVGFSVVYMTVRSPDFSGRWRTAYDEGNTAGRDVIYSAAIDMVLER